jgi:hypothetical protein
MKPTPKEVNAMAEREIRAKRRSTEPRRPLDRLRAICLALPEAAEKETWGEATFRIRDKIFVLHIAADGSFWCKAPRGAQDILVGAAPERFFVPPYLGHKGWIGVRLTRQTDWDEITDLVGRSFRMTAPKRLLAQSG